MSEDSLESKMCSCLSALRGTEVLSSVSHANSEGLGTGLLPRMARQEYEA